jgi:hypothetical protein
MMVKQNGGEKNEYLPDIRNSTAHGIHPNTVRLYEELGLIPKPERKENGYRIFTDFHMEQIQLARTALKVEVLQNGLRKQAITIIKTSALGFRQGNLPDGILSAAD